ASWLDAVLPSLVLGGVGYKRQQATDLSLYYTLLEAKDLDHILTIVGRILTSVVRIGPRGNRICLCYNSSETCCTAHHVGGVCAVLASLSPLPRLHGNRRKADRWRAVDPESTEVVAFVHRALLTCQRQEPNVCPALLFRAWIRTLNRPICGQTL